VPIAACSSSSTSSSLATGILNPPAVASLLLKQPSLMHHYDESCGRNLNQPSKANSDLVRYKALRPQSSREFIGLVLLIHCHPSLLLSTPTTSLSLSLSLSLSVALSAMPKRPAHRRPPRSSSYSPTHLSDGLLHSRCAPLSVLFAIPTDRGVYIHLLPLITESPM
jgi:hypothetical protein